MQVVLDLFSAGFSLSPVPQTDVLKGLFMNVRLLLDDDLRQRVSHLSLAEIRLLLIQLEREAAALRIFLRAAAADKKPRRAAPPRSSSPNRLWN